MKPKNCTQILKGLNKYNYIILLAYRVYVLWCIILLSMKIKAIFKICALRDCPFDRITFGMTPSASMLHGVCSSLLRQHTLRLEAAAK